MTMPRTLPAQRRSRQADGSHGIVGIFRAELAQKPQRLTGRAGALDFMQPVKEALTTCSVNENPFMASAAPQPKGRNWKPAGVIAAAGAMVALASCSVSSPSQYSNTPSSQHSVSSTAPNPPGPVFTNSLGAEMVFIPPGEFMIGSTPEERARAKTMGATDISFEYEGAQPRHSQIRHGFWMGRTELTVGQWQEFVSDTQYQSEAIRGLAVLDSYPEKKPADHPMAWVTWSDAVAFCEWLTRREQHANRLPENCIYRLPSEAEWEYACRGGRQGATFWWGESPKGGHGRLNWRGTGSAARTTVPVDACGVRGRNGFDLADTLGNVREFCLDAWDAAAAHEDFCADYTKSKNRVLKGGSFKSDACDTRCARRWPCPYSCGGADIGFRVCCGIDLSNETTRVLLKLMTPDAKSPPAKNSP
jgi:formylglycine-generating enzyme